MRNYTQNNRTTRGHGGRDRGRSADDEFNAGGMEDSWRNEDYYYFERDEDRRGYDNKDYSGDNYWSGRRDVRDEREFQDPRYAPAVDYGSHSWRSHRNRAYGYGNQGSAQMRDFENWRDGNREEEGYFGRNSNDYRNGYGDDRYYDPHDERRGRPSEGYRESRQSADRYGYGDYQSYPAYTAPGYDEQHYHSWESRRFRNRGDREFGRPHRQYIREKRY